jgi:arylsulfatase
MATPEISVPAAKSIILITIDTLRGDVLGTNGGAARTPCIDGLARRGWSFDNCYANSMLTNPSHASIMTSLYPRDHGVQDNESGIADGVRTIAWAMQRQGRRTFAVLNFPHLNPEVSNLGQGFERVVQATREERRADETSKLALQVIDDLDEHEEFFLWVHYTDPHSPYEPAAEHPPRRLKEGKRTPMKVAAAAAAGFQKKNSWFKKAFSAFKDAEDLEERYVAEVEATDSGLAVLLAGLEDRGRTDRTTIVLTSDHGENFGDHGLYFNHAGLYRSTVHVPLVVSVPGATPVRIAGQVESVDIAPTLLALVDAPRWEPMRGRSLVGLVRGLEPAREFVFSEHMQAQQVAVRGHGGTLILHRKKSSQFPTYRFVSGRREVYNLATDPGEEHDIGAAGPLYDVLEAAIQGYLQAGLQYVARPAIGQDRESLHRLGYVE